MTWNRLKLRLWSRTIVFTLSIKSRKSSYWWKSSLDIFANISQSLLPRSKRYNTAGAATLSGSLPVSEAGTFPWLVTTSKKSHSYWLEIAFSTRKTYTKVLHSLMTRKTKRWRHLAKSCKRRRKIYSVKRAHSDCCQTTTFVTPIRVNWSFLKRSLIGWSRPSQSSGAPIACLFWLICTTKVDAPSGAARSPRSASAVHSPMWI